MLQFNSNFRKETTLIHTELEKMRDRDDNISVYIENWLHADLNRTLKDKEIFWKQ